MIASVQLKGKLLVLCFGLLALTAASSANAADCVVHWKRIACAGQEVESYKKCDGKQECDKNEAAAMSEAGCAKAALADCDNARVDVTKYKIVTALYKGKPVVGGFTVDGKPDPAGLNFCAADRPDLNKGQ